MLRNAGEFDLPRANIYEHARRLSTRHRAATSIAMWLQRIMHARADDEIASQRARPKLMRDNNTIRWKIEPRQLCAKRAVGR